MGVRPGLDGSLQGVPGNNKTREHGSFWFSWRALEAVSALPPQSCKVVQDGGSRKFKGGLRIHVL